MTRPGRGAAHPPSPGQRIAVVGIPGAGKSTLARAVASALASTYVEVDAHLHGPAWTKNPSFVRDLAAAVPADGRWIADGGGPVGRDLVWRRADTLVWLDFPRRVVMWRVVRRSVLRALLRTPLWAGNQEQFRHWRRPSHPVRFAWSQHGPRRQEYAELLTGPRYPHLVVIRLTSPRQAARWRARLRPGGGARAGLVEDGPVPVDEQSPTTHPGARRDGPDHVPGPG